MVVRYPAQPSPGCRCENATKGLVLMLLIALQGRLVLRGMPSAFQLSTLEWDFTSPSSETTPKESGTDYSINNRGGELWIDVQSWAEGLAGWTESNSQLLVATKELNATLVLPDITSGRLVRNGTIDFAEVFNVSYFEDFLGPNKLAHRKEFEIHMARLSSSSSNNGQAARTTFELCLNRCNGAINCSHIGRPHDCVDDIPGTTLKTFFRAERSSVLDEAVKAAALGKKTVLRIHHYWKHSFKYMSVYKAGQNNMTDGATVPLLNQRLSQEFYASSRWIFTDKLHHMADSILRNNGVSPQDNIAVVHWRAEKPNIDYMKCARAIANVKERMALPSNTTFFLMSSLMLDRNLEWGGAKKVAGDSRTVEALQDLIHRHHFRKVESTLTEGSEEAKLDSIMIVALDPIISAKGTHFSTCTKRCKGSYCAECNHLGFFSGFAVNLRKQQGKSSSECWDVSPDFV